MSAASPPIPPPHTTPLPSTNGAQPGRNGGQARQFAHINDLVGQAERRIQPNDTIERLLKCASEALKTAHTNLDFRRPDYALVDFIVANTIISSVVPRHKDYPRIQDQARLRDLYSECIKRFSADRHIYDSLVVQIKDDNRDTGVQPRTGFQTTGSRNGAYGSSHQSQSSSNPRDDFEFRPRSVQLPPPSTTTNGSDHDRSDIQRPLSSTGRDSFQDGRPRPPIHAKPSQLQGHAINGHAPVPAQGGDPLFARFSNLRISTTTAAASSNVNGARDNGVAHSTNDTPVLSGNSSIQATPLYAKQLPKVPSPTYSPAKILQDEIFAPPQPDLDSRTPAMNDSTPHVQPSSLDYVAAESNRPPGAAVNGYRSSTDSTHRHTNNSRQPQDMPQETEIDAQKLFDYLTIFDILLIDVRSREEFDAGHIWNKSIVCIEPAALRPNRSADELQDTLIIGTDDEYVLFSQRQDFDLVVYFDQQTTSTRFLRERGAESAPLRYLYESLQLYNEDKPLKRQPILLIGGMDAWVDLTGKHSLRTSNTVDRRAAPLKPARMIARRPMASGSSRLNISKRRHREYNPLAPEEERTWRDRALSDVMSLDMPTAPPREDDVEDAANEFQLRYPDVPALEHQILVSSPPSRPAPEPPLKHDIPPAVPSRPAPVVARPSYRGVSERAPAQHQQIAKTTHLPQHIPNEMRRLPRTGLFNFGVTCYMNATIQCLSATLPLSAFFLTNRYHAYIQKDNWKGSKGILSGLYAKILEHLWRPKDFDTIRPKHFRQFCARLNREWGYDRQQDAKEFLEFLVDTLHEDLNFAWARNPLRALTPGEELARERTPQFLASKREFARYQHRDNSKITDLFAGQHISQLQCTTCRNSSTTYETFFSLSVEIPPATKGHPVSIHDCLRSYCSSEMLSGDEVWRCPHCQKEREATKRITISQAPEYLVIHLKRFSASHAEKARKVHTPVDFPLVDLDMSPYMLRPPDRATFEQLEGRFGPGSFECETPRAMEPPWRYDAYAVMRHIGGTMTSGHYTALCKDQSTGMWRDYNDDRVSDFRPDKLAASRRLQNEQAYIIFYQRSS